MYLMGITVPLCIECRMLCCWCIQHEDMRKHEASPALVPVICVNIKCINPHLQQLLNKYYLF